MVLYQRDIIKIYVVVGMGCLLLTLSLYLFGFKPLSDRLYTNHYNEIKHLLASGHSLLRSVLDKHIDLARQSASRTAIRNKQIAYLDGKVSRSKFIAFSAHKLADAMNANHDILGIQRHGPHGEILFTVGMPPPLDIVTSCNLESLRKIRIRGPVKVGGVNSLLYCSPIIDRVAGFIGSDILILNDASIKNLVDVPPESFGRFAIVKQGKIIYWPDNIEDSAARGALEDCIKYGCTRQNDTKSAYIFDSLPLNDVGWRLFVVVNEHEFFSDIDHYVLVLLGVITLIFILVLVFTVLTLRPVIRTMLREKQLFEQLHLDGLTGLYNHAYMQILLDQEIDRSQRYGRVFSVLMFDLDHFKNVNDTYGHQAGDIVLKEVSKVTMETIRDSDVAARYGGEEFLLILPETDNEGAQTLAERMRSNVAAMKVSASMVEISVTISVGVLTCEGCSGRYNKQEIVEAVDQAMYTSKNNGRNQVTQVILSK